jgi:4-amino-4-deoxy-L-arabinose transferase-like glycosyltransferase
MSTIVEETTQGEDTSTGATRGRDRGDAGEGATVASSRTWSAIDLACIAGLLCVGVALPLLASAGFHTVGIPQDDDWSYRLIATHFEQTGHMTFDGWPSMTLVGQILLAWPLLRVFGDHGWVFSAMGAIAGVVALSAAYFLARQVLARGWAVGSVLLLILVPGFGWSTSSFMTDVPATAAELSCLALGVVAVRRQGLLRWALLGCSVAVGVLGFSIREFAVVAPMTVLVSAAASDRTRWRIYGGLGVVTIVSCGWIYLWWRSAPGIQPSAFVAPSHAALVRVVQMYFEVAFMLSPAVALVSWRRIRWGRSRGVAAAVVAALIGVAMFPELFLGDHLSQQGLANSLVLVGGRPDLFSNEVWDCLKLVGLVSGALLAGQIFSVDGATLRRWREWPIGRPVGLLCAFTVLYAAALVSFGLTVSLFWDRYAWPLVFVGGVMLLREHGYTSVGWRPGLAVLVAAVLVVVLVAVSAVITMNADAYSAARWRAGQIAVSDGVRPSWVDAGFEWVGAHARSNIVPGREASGASYEMWYELWEPGFQECAVVSGSPLLNPLMRPLGTEEYERYGFAGRTLLYIYVSSAAICRGSG